MPAEWEPQEAIWLAWSDLAELWPGNFSGVEDAYLRLVGTLSQSELVRLLVRDESVKLHARNLLAERGARSENIQYFVLPYDDCWMRDNGPIFLTHPSGKKIVIDWGFNGWGDKFGPYDKDDVVPQHIAKTLGLECFQPGIILEGGSIENNGQGLLMTSEQCLLHTNRNGAKTRADLEPYLFDYFGADKVIWLHQGLVNDHTDGHIDNLARFVASDHVVAVVAEDASHPDYDSTHENLGILRSSKDARGRSLRVTTIPLPPPLEVEGEAMSPSHANFILANHLIVMPTYGFETDGQALAILSKIFPDRRVVGQPSIDILRGGGSFHCISQQEPRVPSAGESRTSVSFGKDG